MMLAFAHGAASILIRKRHDGDSALETVSILILTAYASSLALAAYIIGSWYFTDPFRMPDLLLVALGLFAAAHATGTKVFTRVALGVLAVDFFFMLTGGYAVLVTYGTVFSALIYMIVYAAILLYEWLRLGEQRRVELLVGIHVILLVLYELSIIAIFGISALYSYAVKRFDEKPIV